MHLVFLVLFIFFIIFPLTISGFALDRSYAVHQGETFNFDVISGQNPNQSSGFGGFTRTGSFPFTRTGSIPFTRPSSGFGNGFFGNFGNFNYTNFVVRPSFRVPTTGTIYSVTLTQLPTNTTQGDFTYNIPGQQSTDVSSYYAYGEPIVSIDWNGWQSELNNVVTKIKTLSTVQSASITIDPNVGGQFSSSITIDITPPTFNNTNGFNFQISSIELVQNIRYDRNTGIRQSYSLTSQITNQNGQRTQTTEIDYTTQNTRVAPGSSNSTINNILMIGLIAIVILPMVGLFIYRTKQKGRSQLEIIKRADLKQKALVDDLKSRLQNVENKGSKFNNSGKQDIKISAKPSSTPNQNLPSKNEPLFKNLDYSKSSLPGKSSKEGNKTKFKARRR